MNQQPSSSNNLNSIQQTAVASQQKELKVFNNQFVVRKKLSSGSFGVVFQGEDRLTGEQIALKIEKDDTDEAKSLDRESHILTRLQGIRGIPKLYWSGTEGNYNIMVIQLLGRDLAHHIKVLKRFSLKTTLMLADSLLNLLEQCHFKSVVHRDLKPENVLVGLNQSEIYLVDFGISKIYRDNKGVHMQQFLDMQNSPFRDDKPFIGTTRYAAVAAHKGQELGRCDDLESLGYMLVFLYKGQLPWQNLQNVSDRDKTKMVGKMKMQIDVNDLCKEMPLEFSQFFEYVKQLQFKATPDYRYLQSLIRKCAADNNLEFDGKFDWTEKSTEMNTDKKKNRLRSQQKMGIESEKPIRTRTPIIGETREKKPSIVPDLQSVSQQSSQFDFLRPPDPHSKGKGLLKRVSERHKSVNSLAPSQYSAVNTVLSSIQNKYQGSNLFNDFGDDQQIKEAKKLQQYEPQDAAQQGKQYAFIPLEKSESFVQDRNETMKIDEDDSSGPSNIYQQLVNTQVKAQFKSQIQKRKSPS